MPKSCSICGAEYIDKINQMLFDGKEVPEIKIWWQKQHKEDTNQTIEFYDLPSVASFSRHTNNCLPRMNNNLALQRIEAESTVSAYVLQNGLIKLANGEELQKIDPQQYLDIIITLAAHNALARPNKVSIRDGIEGIKALVSGTQNKVFGVTDDPVQRLFFDTISKDSIIIEKPRKEKKRKTLTYQEEDITNDDSEVIDESRVIDL